MVLKSGVETPIAIMADEQFDLDTSAPLPVHSREKPFIDFTDQ